MTVELTKEEVISLGKQAEAYGQTATANSLARFAKLVLAYRREENWPESAEVRMGNIVRNGECLEIYELPQYKGCNK